MCKIASNIEHNELHRMFTLPILNFQKQRKAFEERKSLENRLNIDRKTKHIYDPIRGQNSV